MGICFVGKRKHGEFLNEYIAPPSASEASAATENDMSSSLPLTLECINVEDQSMIVELDPLQHPSLMYATSGQGARLSGASQKWFVVDKEAKNRHPQARLLLCPGTHHPALYSDSLYIAKDAFHWMMGGIPPSLPFQAKCRIRHLQPLVSCEIDFDSNNDMYMTRISSV
ncbi:MAG: hypothetical protein SGARI_004046 [Bacillariaceae sp.]